MIANPSFRWRRARIILIAIFLLLMSSRVQAVKPSGEGDEWLKWEKQRQSKSMCALIYKECKMDSSRVA